MFQNRANSLISAENTHRIQPGDFFVFHDPSQNYTWSYEVSMAGVNGPDVIKDKTDAVTLTWANFNTALRHYQIQAVYGLFSSVKKC